MNRASRTLIYAAVGALTLGIVVLVKQRSGHRTTSGAAENAVTNLTSEVRVLQAVIHSAHDSLRTATNPAAAVQTLATLRNELARTQRADAVAAVREFLDSGQDAPTHLGFKLNADGSLAEAPTLRTFLLNELATLDPVAAAAYARSILSRKDSPDEWAVALRNLARGDASDEARVLLEQKLDEMLRYQPWISDPSTGFLEAFDVAVYLGGTNLIPTLTELVRSKDNQVVAHAAFLALDRLTIADATATLSLLKANPDLMAGREVTRANYFARADVRDPMQRQLLETYLLSPTLGAIELETFIGVYPNANFMVSHNLLTQVVTPDAAGLIARDAEALHLVKQWFGDPRFAKLNSQLEKVKSRLEEFARQANQGR